MDFEPSDYRIPGGNAVTLSAALAKEIKDRFFRDRDNRFHIYLLAAGLRRTYLQTSEGGKESYTPEFRGWYAGNKLEKLFGQLGSSFSKYAAAELFDFDKFGDHSGCVKLDEVYECLNRLHDLVNELDANDTKFRILSNRDYLENGYKVREERSDPAMRIKLRTDQKKREAKHKAAVAKAKAAGKKLPKSKKAKPDYRKLQALDLSTVTGIIK